MLPDEQISKLPAFICLGCQKTIKGIPYDIVEIRGNITGESSLEVRIYGMCKECSELVRDLKGLVIRTDMR